MIFSDKGLPKAMVKPNILTHVIEGYVIQEAGEPFAVIIYSAIAFVTLIVFKGVRKQILCQISYHICPSRLIDRSANGQQIKSKIRKTSCLLPMNLLVSRKPSHDITGF